MLYGCMKNERGLAMLVGLAMLLMLGLLGASVMLNATSDMNISENFQHGTKSFYIAESGIEHAHAVIRDSADWRAGLTGYSFARGSYDVVVTDKTTDPALGDTILLLSTGYRSGAQSTIEAKLAPTKPFQWAAFAKHDMSLSGTSFTDSYDSDSGTYAATRRLSDGNIGSNEEVTLRGNTTINGDASSATPGSVSITGSATVSGDTTSTAPIQVFDPVPQSEIDYARLHNSAPAGLSGVYDYDAGAGSLTVQPHKTLTLAGGTYYFTSLQIKGNIVVAPGAIAEIYLIGDMTLEAQARVNVGGQPIQLQINTVGQNIHIAGGAEIHSVVYAPDTQIHLTGGGSLYGAYIGNVAFDAGNADFHYDRSLKNLQGKHFCKVSWREI